MPFFAGLAALLFQTFDLEPEPPVRGDVSIRPEGEWDGESFGMILRQVPVLGAALPGEALSGLEEHSEGGQEAPGGSEGTLAPESPEIDAPSDPETPTGPEPPLRTLLKTLRARKRRM